MKNKITKASHRFAGFIQRKRKRVERRKFARFVRRMEVEANGWLCICGHWETRFCHCRCCGYAAPWGCDCGYQDERRSYGDDYDYDEQWTPFEQEEYTEMSL